MPNTATKEELDAISMEVLKELMSLHTLYPQMSPAMFIKLALGSISIAPPKPMKGLTTDTSGVHLFFLPTGNVLAAFAMEIDG